jgi:hypothetical protein
VEECSWLLSARDRVGLPLPEGSTRLGEAEVGAEPFQVGALGDVAEVAVGTDEAMGDAGPGTLLAESVHGEQIGPAGQQRGQPLVRPEARRPGEEQAPARCGGPGLQSPWQAGEPVPRPRATPGRARAGSGERTAPVVDAGLGDGSEKPPAQRRRAQCQWSEIRGHFPPQCGRSWD